VDVPEGEAVRIEREERSRALREVWPNTPMPYLGGRTPAQAAGSGNARAALRAAVFRMQVASSVGADDADFAALRNALNLPPEPEIDPEAVDIEAVHLARLHLIPADRLDDDRLVALFQRARQSMEPLALERAARAIVERPALFEDRVDVLAVYSQLASLASSRGLAGEAMEWVRRGRQADPGPQRARHAPSWDLLEIRLRARFEPPESWVPELAVVLERYREDAAAGQAILVNLVSMGLVQMLPHPDNPEALMFDTRTLEAVLARYGPRVTTASGRLGVAESKGEIWTPGSPAAGGGAGLWTPGASSGAAPSGEKSKIIVPGR
jgi:hypothetical protein